MRKWEYKKVALDEAARKRDDIDLLCGAGEQGWELVAILANNIAYLKREIDDPDVDYAVSGAETASTHEVKPKYRDPATRPNGDVAQTQARCRRGYRRLSRMTVQGDRTAG